MEELVRSIADLPPQEFLQLADWVLAQRDALWDAQLHDDASAGKLDFLSREAHEESSQGSAPDWP